MRFYEDTSVLLRGLPPWLMFDVCKHTSYRVLLSHLRL